MKHAGGRSPKDDQVMVSGVCFILYTGVPWRDLPKGFGPWGSVYTRVRKWTQAKLWSKVRELLVPGAPGQLHSIYCSHIKVHQDFETFATIPDWLHFEVELSRWRGVVRAGL